MIVRAFLTSIGERTTKICKEQLIKLGFDVVTLDKVESWEDKYRFFINTINEDCIRIDADVIPNEYLNLALNRMTFDTSYESPLMAQFKGYDFYKNRIGIIGITFYSKMALEIIRNNLDKIDWRRPEATAWRLREINDHTFTSGYICGLHGFFQDDAHLARHLQNKIDRKQIKDYDFELAKKLLKL